MIDEWFGGERVCPTGPELRLGEIARPEHARQSIQIAMESFGSVP